MMAYKDTMYKLLKEAHGIYLSEEAGFTPEDESIKGDNNGKKKKNKKNQRNGKNKTCKDRSR